MTKKPLNFNWQFKTPFETQDLEGFTGQIVDIPHNAVDIPLQYFDERMTQGIHSYQKTFEATPKAGRRCFIRFDAVMTKADVYLNGTHLVHHIGGYTPFTVEITDAVKLGENRLFVKVDTHESPDHPPFGGVIDYLTYGGIYREVFLIETAEDFIEHVFIDGSADTLNVRLQGNVTTATSRTITFLVNDGDKTVLEYVCDQPLTKDVVFSLPHTLKLWTLEHPKQYTALIAVDGEPALPVRFGIRTIEVTDRDFLLNGEKVFLRGLNRHQSFPYVGYAMPKSAQEEDADILKHTLGVNIVRSSHYPPSVHFLNRCDEIGLLVFTELPGWQHLGDDAWKTHALNDLKTLTIESYNHPSVVIIGTRINESIDDDAFYAKTRDLVKSLDQTRPTGGVRYFGKSHLLEDIYTLNDFFHRGSNKGLSKKKHMTSSSHPYLITEFNGHMFPTKTYDSESRRIEHAKRHLTVLDAAYGMKGVMGAIGWCMADYNTHKDFGSNDHICHHGVLDMGRNNKFAAAAYASQREEPFMDILSMMHIGDKENGELKEVIVATNMEEIALYKNDVLIGIYTRDTKHWPNLPYPPIIIKDFIGNQIKDNEPFSEKDAAKIKRVLLKTLERDLKMRLWHKLMMGWILFKYKLTYHDAVKLYTRYIGGWGEAAKTYRFEGRKNGETRVCMFKGHNDEYTLKVRTLKDTLVIGDTYDTARITAELSNAFSERAYYTALTCEVKVSDHLELIGPSTLTLQGGMRAFWVKTRKPGNASVIIKPQDGEAITLHMTIKKP